MAIGLLDLPNELLLRLGEVSPNSVLSSLILTNRRLAQLLNPILWQLEDDASEDMSFDEMGLPMGLTPSLNNTVELLSYAVSTNNLPMLKKVLQQCHLNYQSDPDTVDHPFQNAVDSGQSECAHMVLTAMEEQNETFDADTVVATIISAMDHDDLTIAERLLRHSRIRKKSWIGIAKHALKMNNDQLLRITLDSSSQSDPALVQTDLNNLLHFAANIGHVPSLALLTDLGADVMMPGITVETRRETPIHTAARRKNTDAVAWMVNHGVNFSPKGSPEETVVAVANDKFPTAELFASPPPDLCSKYCDDSLYPPPPRGLPTGFGVEVRDFDRCILSLALSTSPETISQLLDQLDIPRIGDEILFRTASWRGNKLLLQQLLARGVSFAARRENNNVLHCIGLNEFDRGTDDNRYNVEAAEYILDVRPETLLEVGKNGDTPLHSAFWGLQPFLITALLKRGADPYVLNNHGVTPIGLMPDYWGDRSRQMFSQYL